MVYDDLALSALAYAQEPLGHAQQGIGFPYRELRLLAW